MTILIFGIIFFTITFMLAIVFFIRGVKKLNHKIILLSALVAFISEIMCGSCYNQMIQESHAILVITDNQTGTITAIIENVPFEKDKLGKPLSADDIGLNITKRENFTYTFVKDLENFG